MSITLSGDALVLARKLAHGELARARDSAYRYDHQAKVGYGDMDPEVIERYESGRRESHKAVSRAKALVRELWETP